MAAGQTLLLTVHHIVSDGWSVRVFVKELAALLESFAAGRESPLAELPGVDRERVLLMPQGVTAEEVRARGLWLVEECKRHGYRYCPRLHIDLYGHRSGT